ncbi:hypothetical protein Tco_0922860, partial [Tanacetum coccineum]
IVIRTMSSPNRSTSDIEDAFSSMNILNYTSVSSDYFPASAGSRSFNSSENSKDNMIPRAIAVSPSRLKEPVVALANSFASLANDDAAEWGDESTWTNAQ